ncbi:MAG: hypothetical protein ABI707_04670, partial [Ferruginibacter sp.]
MLKTCDSAASGNIPFISTGCLFEFLQMATKKIKIAMAVASIIPRAVNRNRGRFIQLSCLLNSVCKKTIERPLDGKLADFYL